MLKFTQTYKYLIFKVIQHPDNLSPIKYNAPVVCIYTLSDCRQHTAIIGSTVTAVNGIIKNYKLISFSRQCTLNSSVSPVSDTIGVCR